MTSKVLAEILTKYGHSERNEDKIRVSGEVEADLFASIGEETLNIRRITELHLLHDVLVVTTGKGDRYVMAYEDVRVVHFAPAKSKRTGY